MRLRQVAGLLAPVVLIAAAMALQAERSGLGEAMAAAPVAPAASALISGDYLVAAPGRVEPASQAIMVAAPITGVLKDIDVKDGDHVRRGDVVG
ncbi:MAG: hypothetical protein ACREFQ_19230, partial [Stellaceae bacterium]